MQDDRARPLGRVLLTGSTGMVGSSVLAALLEEDSATKVVALGRRPSGKNQAKLTDVVFSTFADPESYARHVAGIDTVFHCLATYSARVSREAYEEITIGWLSALLKSCEATAPGVTFCLFSAQGARQDGGGVSFALRIKGRAENAVFASGLDRRFAFRPGYIAPSGPSHHWKAADYLAAPLQRLLPSIGVTSDELAHAMLITARYDRRDAAVLENADMRALLP